MLCHNIINIIQVTKVQSMATRKTLFETLQTFAAHNMYDTGAFTVNGKERRNQRLLSIPAMSPSMSPSMSRGYSLGVIKDAGSVHHFRVVSITAYLPLGPAIETSAGKVRSGVGSPTHCRKFRVGPVKTHF